MTRRDLIRSGGLVTATAALAIVARIVPMPPKPLFHAEGLAVLTSEAWNDLVGAVEELQKAPR